MTIEIKVPEIGESITEVQVGEWIKNEGDSAAQDENLVLIETDKATVEIPAPAAGRIARILKKSGDKATVGEVIGHIEEVEQVDQGATAGDREEHAKEETSQAAAPEPSPSAPLVASRTDGREDGASRAEAQPVEEKDEAHEGRQRRDTRNARRPSTAETREKRIDREHVDHKTRKAPAPQEPGNPPDLAERRDDDGTSAPAPLRLIIQGGRDESREEAPVPRERREIGEREEKISPMSPLRRRIAERLVQAQQNAAFLTTFNEVDMSSVIALRAQHRQSFEAKHAVKLGFMSFFVKAVIAALQHVPEVNAEIRGDDIVMHGYCDIGVAVSGGKGLVVPVLRNAERMSFAEIERAIGDFAQRARDNRLKPNELEGGTFTITNGGVFGSLLSTPIINPPQSGILGMHAVQERPVVRDGAVVARPMMYIALTYDHRLIDGREAVTFLKQVKELVEEPTRILLEL